MDFRHVYFPVIWFSAVHYRATRALYSSICNLEVRPSVQKKHFHRVRVSPQYKRKVTYCRLQEKHETFRHFRAQLKFSSARGFSKHSDGFWNPFGVLSRGKNGPGMRLTTHLRLLSRLAIRGAVPPLTLCDITVCGGTILHFTLLRISKAYENVKFVSSVFSLIFFVIKITCRAHHMAKYVRNPRDCQY